LISATTPDPLAAPDEVRFARFAFLDFMHFWGRPMRDMTRPDHVRIFGITDRPVYRPEHPVHFKAWIRRVQYDKPEDTSFFAGQSYLVKIRDARNEVVYQETLKADTFAGIEGTWSLPASATWVHTSWR
jgi:alpha-2-macroglobulin